MDLNDALKQFEAVEANLAKLDQLWNQIKKLMPSINEIQVKEEEQYLHIMRCFQQITTQMPKIDGFELKVCLDHPDDIMRLKLDSLDGELSERAALDSDLYRQGQMLNDYRFRSESKRRELARQNIRELVARIDANLIDLKTP